MCRERRAWQGETKQRTLVRNEEQRSQDRRARCNRVHSAVTYKVKMNEGRKVNIHAALEMFTSGQLLFIGSVCCRWRTGPRQRQRPARNSLLRHTRPRWRWVPGSRLDRASFAIFLIAAYARSDWASGGFSIKKGLVAPCGGRQLVTVGGTHD